MKEQTFVLNFKDGTNKLLWCKKEDYRKLVNITILNRPSDKVKHRPFMIEI